ncbi:hypothetical protein FRZ67_19835 [Panacibacter ginsenosidivorans]|uniref:Uncharacterized protein n=1 Tax=Panacibacter ginsenosidivorans TaxID=1813871 RepID=A0A5B8VEI9_9BACT|nr:hypothetical protein [Panacibacter ginsenosidivorans]QEC69443.1 hypothetical protein FRZ67_19835 [Panacibacter ginsenosidivorans]
MCTKNNQIVIIIALSFVLSVVSVKSYSQQFSRQQFYKAMAGKNADEIDAQLAALKQSSITGKEAFEGALLMKKADIAGSKKEKLNLFKSGKAKLEAVIAKDTSNAEYRFLRLQIQEHAPKVVKYSDKLKSDKMFISKEYKNLLPEIQQAIFDYSKQSKILLPADI